MRIIPVLIIWFLFELFAFQSLQSALVGFDPDFIYVFYTLYWLVDVFLLGAILQQVSKGNMTSGPTNKLNWLMALVMLSVVPKIFISLFLLLEDVFRFGDALFHIGERATFFADRSTWWNRIVLLTAFIPFSGILYGVRKGKYAYKVHKVILKFKDLPAAFHGFTISQISDVHSGSFDNRAAVEKGIALVNEQKSDIVVFTGDLVNNRAEEMDEWISSFAQLKAQHGKFSILGNHDYGDYIPWESAIAKQENLQRLKNVHCEMGFRLLLNENFEIEKNGASISLVGIENWGNRGFAKYGDLNKALHDVDENAFKILLSHDPSHWEAQTLVHDKHVHLTLAGHTHGMQFGIEIWGFKWSPVKYIYRQWAGLYQRGEKHLYVNRGFGFIGFPGRVGIMPEITVLELQRA